MNVSAKLIGKLPNSFQDIPLKNTSFNHMVALEKKSEEP